MTLVVLALLDSAVTIEGDTAKALGGLLLVAIGVNGAAVIGQANLRRKLGELYTAMLGLDGKSGLLSRVQSLHDARNDSQQIEVRVSVLENSKHDIERRMTTVERRHSIRRSEDRGDET